MQDPHRKWQDLGCPEVITTATLAVADAFEHLNNCMSQTGNLFDILNGWKVDDNSLTKCRINIARSPTYDEGQLQIEYEILDTMQMMTLDERLSAMAIYEGVVYVSPWKRFWVTFTEAFARAFREAFAKDRKRA